MKILSFQPNSIYRNGGASRVLRRLYEHREASVVSLFIQGDLQNVKLGEINEIGVKTIIRYRPWIRWRFRNLFFLTRDKLLKFITIRRIRRVAENISFDVLHVINHGDYCTSLCTNNILANSELWVSFHDHYSLCSSFEDTKLLWDLSSRRLVISNELGHEYEKQFGNKGFELITDGVSFDEVSTSTKINRDDAITVYFAGLLHLDYIPLVSVLADALDILADEGFKINFVLRGISDLSVLKKRRFGVEFRNEYVSDEEIKAEVDSGSILYLPIKFSHPAFYLYSLSTKMVSYLGASGSILFHGPKDSAACNLLSQTSSAVCCTSLDKNDLRKAIITLIDGDGTVSNNAKQLAKNSFNLSEIQSKFWRTKL